MEYRLSDVINSDDCIFFQIFKEYKILYRNGKLSKNDIELMFKEFKKRTTKIKTPSYKKCFNSYWSK